MSNRAPSLASFRDDDTDSEIGPGSTPSVPAWAAALPCCIRAPLDFCCLSLHRPGDTFLEALRKNVIGICPIVGALLLGTTISKASSAEDLHTVGGLLAAFSQLISACAYFVAWLVARCDPDKNGVAIDIGLAGTVGSLTITAISDVAYPVWAPAAQIAIIALSMRSTRAVLLVPVCALLCLLSMYNQALLLPEPGRPAALAAVPDAPINRSLASRFFNQFVVFLIYAVTVGIVEMQLREAARRTVAAKASLDLASELADALAQYDTGTAAARIAAARGANEADVALLDRFDTIVANLTRYRPHLPNWLVHRADGSVHSGDLNGGNRSTDAAGSADPFSDKVVETPKSRRSLAASMNSNNSSAGGSAFSASVHSPNLGFGRGAGLMADSLSGPGSGSAPFRARIVLAEVGFAIPTVGMLMRTGNVEDIATARIAIAAAGHGFVDRVYKLAGSTSGAVHAFVGDVARVSWNAAAKAVQPEAKVARFFVRLKQDPGHTLARAWGAAAHGDARVQLAGTGQKGLIITPSFSDTLAAAFALASEHETFIVDQRVYEGSNFSVSSRGVAVVPVVPTKRRLFSPRSLHGAGGGNSNVATPVATQMSAMPATAKAHAAAASDRDPLVPQLPQPRVDDPVSPPAALAGEPAAAPAAPGQPSGNAPNVPQPRLKPFFEVGRELAEGSEEWLYVLEARDAQVTANVDAALSAAAILGAADRPQEALRALSAVDLGGASEGEPQSPIVTHFVSWLTQRAAAQDCGSRHGGNSSAAGLPSFEGDGQPCGTVSAIATPAPASTAGADAVDLADSGADIPGMLLSGGANMS